MNRNLPLLFRSSCLGVILLACVRLCAAQASANLLPNPEFRAEAGEPRGWKLVGGQGEWRSSAWGGLPALLARGTGKDSSHWRTEKIALQPGGLYQMLFHGRRDAGASGGTAMSGPERVNRDFPLDTEWRQNKFVFQAPSDSGADCVRLGQWEVDGSLTFAAPILRPVMASHIEVGPGLELGEGESIEENRYRFWADFGWAGANFHRPLATNRAGFNSNRWVFWPGAEVVYRHRVVDFTQRSGNLRVAINHHVGGTLRVEASRDGKTWLSVAEFDGQRRGGEVALPAGLFPSAEVMVRLSCVGGEGGFQVNAYGYDSELEGEAPEAQGETVFVATTEIRDGLRLELSPRRVETPFALELALSNLSNEPITINEMFWEQEGQQAVVAMHKMRLNPGARQLAKSDIRLSGAGERRVRLGLRDRTGGVVWAGETSVRLGILQDATYGQWLAEKHGVTVWWCESGWKVGRSRPAPDRPALGKARPVEVSAARGEFEAAQVVLKPERDLTLLGAEVGTWRGPGAERVHPSVRIDEVAYVHVTQPTDDACMRGWYPDPLPPLRTPLALKGLMNQPLWLTFHVPAEARPGDYASSLKLRTSRGNLEVPLKLHVYGFAVPKETHLRSALGLGAEAINRYHRLTNRSDQTAVFEKYLKNFAEHRISPYSFHDYAPIQVRFAGDGSDKRPEVDFSQFDTAAERWLGPGGFNTFLLPIEGMGGGTFHERHLGSFGGFKEGTPEHARLFKDYLGRVESHLRVRGWLDRAFTYWFDEPDPKDYEFVVQGMRRIKEAAPGVKRMLTEQPEPALIGHVDIWCALTPEWTPERVRARRDAGDEVWWYICTGPKAPFVTEFIDHPGTELRLWPWQSWQWDISGILIWATIYWTSPVAYPEPQIQNPWLDPMSWVTGYGTPVGTRSPWGNGDGRFLYPPRRYPNSDTTPSLDDPINSIRWENLRDGMEDFEYFWFLAQEVRRLSMSGKSDLVRNAEALLKVPDTVSRDLTHFTTNPRPILEHRDRVATMIERLARER